MVSIDPTARVDAGADLGEGVVVGPWCRIGPNVRIGNGTVLDSMAVVDGHTEIGPRCRLHHGAVVGTPPQDLKYAGAPTRCLVGSDCVFREYSTVNRSTLEADPTTMGSHCLVMAYAHVAHNCHLGDHVILANAATLAGHVTIGDWAIVGGVTPVHQFVEVGEHAFVGGGSRIPQDVPPFVKVAGNPARVAGLNGIGLTRRGFTAEQRSLLKKAYVLLFRSGLNVSQALERIDAELPRTDEISMLVDFIRASKRGIIR